MRVEASKDPKNPYRLVFVGQPEIEVVRTAFIEHVYGIERRGNTVAKGSFDRRVASWWPLDEKKRPIRERAIHAMNPLIVTDKLRELHENTDMVTAEMSDVIAEVADVDQFEMRMAGVEWRYRLGNRALALAQVVDLKVSEHIVEGQATVDLDAVFARILAPKLLEE